MSTRNEKDAKQGKDSAPLTSARSKMKRDKGSGPRESQQELVEPPGEVMMFEFPAPFPGVKCFACQGNGILNSFRAPIKVVLEESARRAVEQPANLVIWDLAGTDPAKSKPAVGHPIARRLIQPRRQARQLGRRQKKYTSATLSILSDLGPLLDKRIRRAGNVTPARRLDIAARTIKTIKRHNGKLEGTDRKHKGGAPKKYKIGRAAYLKLCGKTNGEIGDALFPGYQGRRRARALRRLLDSARKRISALVGGIYTMIWVDSYEMNEAVSMTLATHLTESGYRRTTREGRLIRERVSELVQQEVENRSYPKKLTKN